MNSWRRAAWTIAAAIVVVLVIVFASRWLRELPGVASFLKTYPGTTALPANAPVGIPAWLNWQHLLNAFFLVLIVRSGWAVRRVARPGAYWTRKNSWLHTKNKPKRISLDLWLHLSLDALWLLNGVIFIVLIIATGQWMRIVPTSWAVLPNALSAALQYSSLRWPTENGWVNYNSLQLLSYFLVVFIAAPLAIVTGLRMSSLWPKEARRLNRLYPIEAARAVHYPVMLFFVLFVIVHVTLVLATGALRNLNHMYASRDDLSWWGLLVFVVSLVVMAAAWFAARPVILRPIAALTGKLSR